MARRRFLRWQVRFGPPFGEFGYMWGLGFGSLTRPPRQWEIRLGPISIDILLFCFVLPGEWLFVDLHTPRGFHSWHCGRRPDVIT